MTFDGPHLDDYQNVASLNRAFLRVLRREGLNNKRPRSLPQEPAERIAALNDNQLQRLSELPFLLIGFREQDDQYWDRLLADEPRRDLFAATASEDMRDVLSASIAFIWQMARQNPYALRLICGSTLYWSERIAEQKLVRLVATVCSHTDLPELRNICDVYMWRKLLIDGISRNRVVRRSAHLSALQTVLTRQVTAERMPRSRAARNIQGPGSSNTPLARTKGGGV